MRRLEINHRGQVMKINVFHTGEYVEHDGKDAKVLRMIEGEKGLTGDVELVLRDGSIYEVWSNCVFEREWRGALQNINAGSVYGGDDEAYA